MLVAIILISAIILGTLTTNNNIFGFIAYEGNIKTYEDNVNIEKNSSGYYVWVPSENITGYLNSIKLSGEYKGTGIAKIFLEDGDGNKYLITSIDASPSFHRITGYLIKGGKQLTPQIKETTPSSTQNKLTTKSIKALTKMQIVPFIYQCEETCSLLDKKLNYSSYKLYFEINGAGTITINQIQYSIVANNQSNKVENKTNLTTSNLTTPSEKIYRKIKDDKNFDVSINQAEFNGSNLVIVFSHNSTKEQPFYIIGNVTYGFSKNPAPPNENITLTIYNWDGSKFLLQVGNQSEVFEFEIVNQTKVNTTNKTANISISNISLVNLNGKPLSAKIIIQNTSSNGKLTTMNVGTPKKTVIIIPQNVPVKTMKIVGIDLSKNPKIVIDKINKTNKFSKMYIIDPTNTDFEKAEVTVDAAKGNVLLKCKTWNTTTQTCEDPCNGTKCNIPKWQKVMDLTPGESYTFTMTKEDPAFGEVNISSCAAEEKSSKGSWDSSCDYPDGSALISDGGNVETHDYSSSTFGGDTYAGVKITASNTSATDCASIKKVYLCYEWWDSGNPNDCDISVDANGGSSFTAVTTTCPGTTANPGLTCTDVTSLESWSCSSFFGSSGTKAQAKSEMTATSSLFGNSGTATWDALYFNVTYNAYPKWSNPSTNDTNHNVPTKFSVYWTDDYGLSGYIFSTNNSGSWVNDSWVSLSGTTSWVNVTKTLTSTNGAVVGWRVYVNDSDGAWNDTGIQTLTTTNTAPTLTTNPTVNDTSPNQDDLIKCNPGTYSDANRDSKSADYWRWWNITGTPSIVGTNQILNLSAIGASGGEVYICSQKVYDGYDNSSWYNSTNNATVISPSCIVSLNTSTINFSSVSPGTDTGSTNQVVNVTNSGNAQATNVTIKGTAWSDGGSNTMPVGQTEWGTSGFAYGSGTALTTSDAVVTSNLGAGSSILIYFGLGVPQGQAAGSYTQTITLSMNC